MKKVTFLSVLIDLFEGFVDSICELGMAFREPLLNLLLIILLPIWYPTTWLLAQIKIRQMKKQSAPKGEEGK